MFIPLKKKFSISCLCKNNFSWPFFLEVLQSSLPNHWKCFFSLLLFLWIVKQLHVESFFLNHYKLLLLYVFYFFYDAVYCTLYFCGFTPTCFSKMALLNSYKKWDNFLFHPLFSLSA